MAEEAKNRRLGELAVRAGYIDADLLGDLLDKYSSWRGLGKGKSFGRFLVDHLILTDEQVRGLISDQRKQPMVCSRPDCRRRYNIRNYNPDKNYGCKRCKSLLGHPTTSSSVEDVDESAGDSAETLLVAGGDDPDQTDAQGVKPGVIDQERTVLLQTGASETGSRLLLLAGSTSPDQSFWASETASAGVAAGPGISPSYFLGRTLGRYEILRLLGSGAMGAVYLARRGGREIAIKLLAPHLADHEALRKRFLREGMVQKSMNHPGIVPVIDVGQEGRIGYIVMELMPGGSLADRLHQEVKLEETEATSVFIAILEGLSYAHQQRFIHRDIKPDNIMLGKDGEIVIADFGLVGILGDDREDRLPDQQPGAASITQSGAVLGTPAYMPPEQIVGGVVDHRSDLYSLGCLMYKTITGRPPFAGVTIPSILKRHVSERPVPPSEYAIISRDLDAIILRLMEKNPNDRFPVADEIIRVIKDGYLDDPQILEKSKRLYSDAKEARSASGSLSSPTIDKSEPDRKRAIKQEASYSTSLMEERRWFKKISPTKWVNARFPRVAWIACAAGLAILAACVFQISAYIRHYERRRATERSALPVVEGFTFLRMETFKCGIQNHTVAIYRCEVFARALGLAARQSEPACEFVLVPAGAFMMGSKEGHSDERPVHRVIIEPYMIARTEVLQKIWWTVMGENPSAFYFGRRDAPHTTSRLPVECVSWKTCQRFCKKAGLRLPSEAEWEYACRAGSKGKWCYGSDVSKLGHYAWYRGNSRGVTHTAGMKMPNAFGLFDCHGNVWEWCLDCQHENYDRAPTSGVPWVDNMNTSSRILRGGSFSSNDHDCRSAFRNWISPDFRSSGLGVRPAMYVDN